MEKSVKRFYWIALLLLMLLSVYPIAMGAKIILLQMQFGKISPDAYAQYVIPYTAVCTSILLTVLLYPLLSKLKRFSIIVASILALGLFVGLELYIEGITIKTPEAQSTLQWQLASCIGTTEAMQAFQKFYDNTFKIHYFLISFLLIILVIGVIYRFDNVIQSKNKEKRNLLVLQITSIIVFIAFCVVANITAFFREAVDYLRPLSSALTGSYFVVMGLSLGLYLSGFISGKSKWISVLLPALAASLVTAFMYYGEYKMLDGVLYRFGYTKFYQPLPYSVVSPVDILIILASGGMTALVLLSVCFFSREKDDDF